MSFVERVTDLARVLPLRDDDAERIRLVGERYPWRLTEYYLSLIDPDDPHCPVRRQAIPDISELDDSYGVPDPLCEDENAPVPGVIHVYPDRVAVVVTNRCPMYCRFCLRKRLPRGAEHDLTGERRERVLRYIAETPSIRDVLLTGGDPLMLADSELDAILRRLRDIPHVEIVRIGTRAVCTWPERITDTLADMLASHHPVWVNTQFNHPREVTSEAAAAVDKLLRTGIPVGNQSVLLKGVNDSVEIMRELVRALVAIRVRPYYLYQAQVLAGTGHFVTTVERGLAVIKGLRGWTTGFAVPQYVLDTPYGKIPLNPEYFQGRAGDYIECQAFNGALWREYNPLPESAEAGDSYTPEHKGLEDAVEHGTHETDRAHRGR